MGFLMWLVSVIAWYVVLSNFIDTDSAASGFVAMAYVFIPLIALPLAIGLVRASTKKPFAAWGITAVVVAAGLFLVQLATGLFPFQRDQPQSQVRQRSQAEQDSIWMLKAQEDIRKALKDGDSAKFEGVFVHRYQGAPLVCGKVNSKNSFGGFTGFQRFIYMGEAMPVVMEENMKAGEFPKSWNTFCAG